MNTFLNRLLRASRWGATLVLAAGCGPTVGGAVTDSSGQTLEPTPETSCTGPVYNDDSGYSGQCCYEVHCAVPTEDGECVAPHYAELTDLPPGSGTCECATRLGPYLNNDASSEEKCCYQVGSIGCAGRPLMVDGAPRLALVVPGSAAWSALDLGATRSGDAALDEVLARGWADRARFEHASVASFARFTMALLACGAPPALVTRSQEAGADEVRHAELALSLASIYAGEPLDLGPLDIDGAFAHPVTLEATALSTVVEACVGETLSAIEMAASASAAASPAARQALSSIAEDEARHAELGWAFVRWAAGVGGAALRSRIAYTFEMAFEKAGNSPSASPADDVPGAIDHGFLPASEVASLRRQAITHVLRPAATALLRDLGARSQRAPGVVVDAPPPLGQGTLAMP